MELKEMRKAANLTQAAVATALGVTQAGISKWERGTDRPTVDKLRPLAILYGRPVAEVLDAILGKEAPDHVNSIPPE
nr:helix-turn-helix transcriptional regulator [uncultured Dysosmobacter sp.]